ncbi:hypothetical protein [Maledivibacter halophilus]|uniref:Uncharacterized protein n=1 Tax=Maledivibacter halophilus TaxID=36842 RepID=A0A1T5IGQ5_9FIRM|nr:hypothetical protein [Maledivibacter halophilus]SKC38193.1 hypothetical protein SAMN02194393_00344 [Maledivibacter halophilus]
MRKKIFRLLIIFILGTTIILNTPLWFPIRSYITMFFYSKLHEKESLMNKNNIKLHIPGGLTTKDRDWYPFVMTFNDDIGFSKYADESLSLTILYNFGGFNLKDGASSYFNPNSKYFSSFYGGYLVKKNESAAPPFGFSGNGKINLDEIALVPKYDQEKLVLSSFGCLEKKMVFDVLVDSIQYNVNYINHQNWIKVDSTIRTNSPIHKFKKKYISYIQYGRPIDKYYNNEDFPIINLKGRTYVKYLENYDISIFLYILAPTANLIEEWDEEFLSKTILDTKR